MAVRRGPSLDASDHMLVRVPHALFNSKYAHRVAWTHLYERDGERVILVMLAITWLVLMMLALSWLTGSLLVAGVVLMALLVTLRG